MKSQTVSDTLNLSISTAILSIIGEKKLEGLKYEQIDMELWRIERTWIVLGSGELDGQVS